MARIVDQNLIENRPGIPAAHALGGGPHEFRPRPFRSAAKRPRHGDGPPLHPRHVAGKIEG